MSNAPGTNGSVSVVNQHAVLWCKTNYSFLHGASRPQELVERAHALGLRALAITDRDGVHGIVQAHVRAKELGLHLIVGSEITLSDQSRIVLLATNLRGYQSLCGLITSGRTRDDVEKGQSIVEWSDVCERAEGLIALWGGAGSALSAPEVPSSIAASLRAAFGDRLYALLARHREESEVAQERRLIERAERFGLPIVAAIETLYHDAERKPLHDVLTCIRHRVSLSTAGRLITTNAEHALMTHDAFARLYRDMPDAIARTLEIADRCRFNLSEIRYRYPSEQLPDGKTSHDHLRDLTWDGARSRLAHVVDPERRRAIDLQIDKELSLIHELEYDGYFLTMHEIVGFCRAQNILCQGRGSAANSVVCYCLGITAVDPTRIDLLFERFLSRERAEPPDIDLDIEHARREEVIQHMYDKYGRTHAAMVANVIRYRLKSAVRDVGKALGIAEVSLDHVSKLLSHHDHVDATVLRDAGLDPEAQASRLLIDLSHQINDFPRHLSIHPGGFLLGHAPIDQLVPREKATMEKRTVIQWDKDDVEALGLFKVDLLALGALTQTHKCFDLIEQHHGQRWSMATVPEDDEATYAMIQKADTVGVFQIESRAQMSMLPRLKPKNYYDLVIEVSIVRPGPISGGMVHPFLRRRNREEEVVYPHPCLEPVLKKTMGVPLFQEQVMKLAVVAADYTPGEADQLRRDMAAWRRTGRIEHHRERLVQRMEDKGIAREFAERVFEQIRGFGEYGFPESHAASFALISYVTSWLKCHYPAIFACGLLNAQPMGFYSAATIIEDTKRHGVTVLPIDVCKSGWDCSIEKDVHERDALRMGLRYVKGIREEETQRLSQLQPPFSSLADFVARCPLTERSLTRLVEAGALDSLGLSRRAALWEALRLSRVPELPLAVERQAMLPGFAELSARETIVWDYQASSHSTRGHPLTHLRDRLKQRGMPSAKDILGMKHGMRIDYAGLVICRQRPATAKGVTFMTLEDETGIVNLVIWQDIFQSQPVIARTASFLGVTGKLQVEGTVIHLVAERLWVPTLTDRPIQRPSRDFH